MALDGKTIRQTKYIHWSISQLEIYKEASEIENSEEREELVKWARSTENYRKRTDMVSIASSIQTITIKANEFDSNHWLFNTLNYTLDLSSGKVVPKKHNPNDFITKISPFKYDPEATCPKWEKFIHEIFPKREEMIIFVKRAIGYSLTGSISEQCLFFCYGTGANGKTVFLETLKMLFGDYAGKAPSEMILQQRYTGIPSDVASLRGKRFVICSEIEENRRLAESKVKDLTGGDTITARKMYGDCILLFEVLESELGT